ncbi:MAG TPA: anti-sigma F factor antagonist [Firmicutes bacterium]|nr:anti-sigma F factor antagonist [Bacillota bacterium]
MEIIYNQSKKCLILRLMGELDDHKAEKIRQMLKKYFLKHPSSSLIINLQKLKFMDSAGVGLILGRYNEVRERGRNVYLCGLNPQIKRVLELSGLLKHIAVFDSENEALSQEE